MSKIQIKKEEQRSKRRKRIRAKISGTADCPRLSVFRSNKFIYGQIVDDLSGKTLVSASSKNQKTGDSRSKAKSTGVEIGSLAVKKGIKKVVFDRGGYIYTGAISAFADGAREAGLIF